VGTQNNVRTAMKRWRGFMMLIGDTAHDGETSYTKKSDEEEDNLMASFLTFLVVREHLAPTTASTYLGYVKTHFAVQFGVSLGRAKGVDSRVRRCKVGLAKLSGHVVSRKKAILTHQVVGIVSAIRQSLGDTPDQRCLTAALQLGFQGLCRKSEYSVTKNKPFAVDTSLTLGDVHFRPSREHPEVAVIVLKKTKTDRFNKEQPELILPMDPTAPVNACRALKDMLDNTPVPPEDWASTPLFVWKGKPLHGDVVHQTVQACMGALGLRPADFGSHSLRAGGATALADAGCPEVVLKALGRWSSECYRLYVRGAFNAAMNWSRQIGTSEAAARSQNMIHTQR
jgi:integrase